MLLTHLYESPRIDGLTPSKMREIKTNIFAYQKKLKQVREYEQHLDWFYSGPHPEQVEAKLDALAQRYTEIINKLKDETKTESQNTQKIAQSIVKNCSDILKSYLGSEPRIVATFNTDVEVFYGKPSINSENELLRMVDERLVELGRTALFSNSKLIYLNHAQFIGSNYDTEYVLYPVNDFKFTMFDQFAYRAVSSGTPIGFADVEKIRRFITKYRNDTTLEIRQSFAHETDFYDADWYSIGTSTGWFSNKWKLQLSTLNAYIDAGKIPANFKEYTKLEDYITKESVDRQILEFSTPNGYDSYHGRAGFGLLHGKYYAIRKDLHSTFVASFGDM